MVEKFRELDDVYDSNLFTPHPFEDWEEYDGSTEKVIEILYGKKGYYEYDFKAMPADVLGSVYENYLGYKLAQSKKGVTLDKSAKKRKEQGLFSALPLKPRAKARKANPLPRPLSTRAARIPLNSI